MKISLVYYGEGNRAFFFGTDLVGQNTNTNCDSKYTTETIEHIQERNLHFTIQ
jgi:hypothetical protein